MTEHIETSAIFGEAYAVRVLYNTEADGTPVDLELSGGVHPETIHGLFDTEEEASQWIDAYPDGDKDIYDMFVITINRVRATK